MNVSENHSVEKLYDDEISFCCCRIQGTDGNTLI
jgi:hypothetical protein